MKKLIIGLVLLITPTMVFAAEGFDVKENATLRKATDVLGIEGKTIKEKREYIEEKVEEAKELKEQVKSYLMTKEEIKTKTKEQIRVARTEVAELKLELKTKFQGVKDLTAEERQELKDEIASIRSQIKEIHISNLNLRAAAIDEIKSIKDKIKEVVTDTVVTDEETENITNVLEDLKTT